MMTIAGKNHIFDPSRQEAGASQGHAICRLELDDGFSRSELLIVKVDYHQGGKHVKSWHTVELLPITFLSVHGGQNPSNTHLKRKHHIDTCVKGGDPTSAFYRKEALRFGYRSLSSVHLNHMALWKEEAP